MKRDKTKKVLLNLTREQSNALGLEVERLIKTDLNYIVNKYVRQYRTAAQDTFGWMDDDLMQHIRVILWKGLATFDASKNFKVTTYLSTILYYQMGNFSKRCQSNKNANSKIYCPEILHSSEELTDYQTAEVWYSYVQSFKSFMDGLDDKEKDVLICHLVNDDSLDSMVQKLKVPRPQIIGMIKSIKQKISKHLEDS